ncbi:MAG: hypothetical protein MR663_05535, partial [Lachnospiraceae bacterium]|nr:hypothetical protein [Lachnospiraceae bacterium]
LLALVLTDEQWLKYSMSQMLQMAQVFVSKSGSNIGCHVAQIFIDIHRRFSVGTELPYKNRLADNFVLSGSCP